MSKIKVLHLSHTDIKEDSRILKEMQSISSGLSCKVYGIGVELNESKVAININNLNIYLIKTKSRGLTILPEPLIHILLLLEVTFKMYRRASKVKAHIIHCHDTVVLPLGVLISIFTKSKVIYDAHELESKDGRSYLSGKATLFIERILWNFIDYLIVVSFSIEKWYKENIGKKNSTVILNSPVLEKNATITDNQYLRKYFSISKSSKIFLYVGILGHGRGIDVITQAFMSSSLSSSLVFLGFGELSDELKELAQKYPNIYVHASVPHEQVVSVAKSADVGLCLIQNVSLSDYYCLPNKLFEYCFAGIPVLASDFPDISRVVTKYGLGMCCKLDSDSIFKAIQEFENMNELPKVNTDELYDLSWGAQEVKLIKLYKNLIQ